MALFDWFRKKRSLNDEELNKLTALIGDVLAIQLSIFGPSIPDLAAPEGARALGYVYGFVDAALRSKGQDMADLKIGVPVTYQVLRRVFPGREDVYLEFIGNSLNHDGIMMSGITLGGQQCLDWLNGKLQAPMGLARCIVDLQPPQPE